MATDDLLNGNPDDRNEFQTPEQQFSCEVPPIPPVKNVTIHLKSAYKFSPLTEDELAGMRKNFISRPATWVMCVALAVIADWFFWQQPCGITLGIFTLLLGGVAFLAAPHKRSVKIPALLVFISGLALMTQTTFRGVILAVLSLASMVVISRSGPLKSIREWFFVLGVFLQQNLRQQTLDMFSTRKKRDDAKEGVSRTLLSIITIILFAMVFIILFIIANPVLEKYASNLSDHLSRWLGDYIILHILFWLAIIFINWTCMRFCMRALGDKDRLGVVLPAFAANFTTQCLIVFNVIFLLQTGTDAFYLWSGVALPDGMTYAQYAHRGAYPLAIAAILAGVFMVFAWSDKKDEQKASPLRRIFAAIWLVQNLFLMICAARRLYLYVSVYSMTGLRFFAGVGMVLVAVGFVLIAVRIYRGRTANWLINANIAAVTLALVFCSFFNSYGWIAQFNVTHCREVSGEGVELDFEYMRELGPAALPAMIRFSEISHNKAAAERATEFVDGMRYKFEHNMKNWRYRTLWRTETLKELE